MTKLCGFIGPVDDKALIAETLRSMAGAMRHAPDAREECMYFECGGVALVKSPRAADGRSTWSEDRSALLAMCGQVVGLDDREARDPAAPGHLGENGALALLRAFERHGQAALETLNGVFAFAYYSAAARSLTIANDRYGFMPLYYACDRGMFAFASEAKAVLRALGRREIDWEAAADFFYIGHMTGQRTLFTGVYALDSAQVLTYQAGALRKRTYYDFTKTPVLAAEEVSAERVAALFTEAVRRRVREDTPNTLLLSGGFDSRLILGALHQLGIAPRVISLEHARGPSGGADARYALRAARDLGLDCDYRQADPHYFASKASLECFYVLDGMVPTWSVLIGALYPELDSGMGAVWDGLALDVALGGAHASAATPRGNLKELLASRATRRLLLRLIVRPDLFRAIDGGFMRRLRGELAAIPASENQYSLFLLKNRTRRRIAVNPYQLYGSKVVPMTPATDSEFLDYVLGIPISRRRHHRLYIEMLRKELPFLTRAPVISGGRVFSFDTGEPAPGAIRASLTRARGRILKVCGLLAPSARAAPAANGGVNNLMVAVLERSCFDRPIYHRALLRRLFERYRRGDSLYHKLFEIVFYIELWHLLFVDAEAHRPLDPRTLVV